MKAFDFILESGQTRCPICDYSLTDVKEKHGDVLPLVHCDGCDAMFLEEVILDMLGPKLKSQWRPAETAPKTGQDVLLHLGDGGIRIAYWCKDFKCWIEQGNVINDRLIFLWAPIPSMMEAE